MTDISKPTIASGTRETTFKIFSRRAMEIQSHCCCRSYNERECYRLRYPLPVDDISRWDALSELDDGWEWNRCECACHGEIGELERDLWPEDDE